MRRDKLRNDPIVQTGLDTALGYLNFSSGSRDLSVLKALDAIFRRIEENEKSSDDTVATLHDLLSERLVELSSAGGPFADVTQAKRILSTWWNGVVPGYCEFHKELLFRQPRNEKWRPFFIGCVWEVMLAQSPPPKDVTRYVKNTIASLNDYVGYRPVAVLENRACEPYAHERIRPIPLFIRGAGVACGSYEKLIANALDVLSKSDDGLLRNAWFDLTALEELALDPRPYDFDHPVNRRPAYQFGQWDPHRIDNRGQYRRFVLQRVALDALMERVNQSAPEDRDERLFEAGAVLAGTMLMASGLCGNGPGCHDSDVTLATLLPHIAGYRDQFYIRLLETLPDERGDRLRNEAKRLHQPFGGARQHLNQQLAKRRAEQLQHAHLAVLCARMGYPDAANRHADAVQLASARISSRLHCLLTDAHDAIDQGRLHDVPAIIDSIENRILTGIRCGALVDPWNIVGFGGNFAIFPSVEDSIHDFRVEKLIDLVEQSLDLCARAWSEAAAQDAADLERQFSEWIARMAAWWDKFATSTVESVPCLVGKEVEISANLVSGALNSWHKAGAAAGDIGFWRMFVDQFDSPKAFQLVVEALLEQNDCIASSALMIQWVSQANRIPLELGESSLHDLVRKWFHLATADSHAGPAEWWPNVRRFIELLEANADEYWQVPEMRIDSDGASRSASPGEDEDDANLWTEDDDESEVFSAAYEDVVFRDSTDDGVDDSMLGFGADPSEFELEEEAERLIDRLKFLSTVAWLWQQTAIALSSATADRRSIAPPEGAIPLLEVWRHDANSHFAQLGELLREAQAYPVSPMSRTRQELQEYDRRRLVKDSLLDSITDTCVEMGVAVQMLTAACGEGALPIRADMLDRESTPLGVMIGLLHGDPTKARRAWPEMKTWLQEQGLLYVPLTRGGDPEVVVRAKSRQRFLRQLFNWAPRLGMIQETCELLTLAHAMERDHPVGHGAVTEFDRLFKAGYLAMVRCLVKSSTTWNCDEDAPGGDGPLEPSESKLFEALQRLTELQLTVWLEHSHSLRISVVEKVADDESWASFVQFVKKYGGDLFTQTFLGMANIRAILHQGVDRYLEAAQEELDDDSPRLARDFGKKIDRREAVRWLSLALEAVAENYAEYRDYNSTTTQSDHGDQLHAFIDFLRLRNEYDRVAWNLRPVVLAHDVLARYGHSAVAEEWRRALIARTADAADQFTRQHEELCARYGMQLPTIAGRIAERLTRPLDVGRIRALVRPAVENALGDNSMEPFNSLEIEIANIAGQPNGSGLDMPDWLDALESEVDHARAILHANGRDLDRGPEIPQMRISWADLCGQLDEAERDRDC